MGLAQELDGSGKIPKWMMTGATPMTLEPPHIYIYVYTHIYIYTYTYTYTYTCLDVWMDVWNLVRFN